MDVSEVKDVLNYGQALATKLAESKSDDGKISSGEVMADLFETAPEAVKAFVGANDIQKELAAATPEQKQELLLQSLDVAKLFIGIFFPMPQPPKAA